MKSMYDDESVFSKVCWSFKLCSNSFITYLNKHKYNEVRKKTRDKIELFCHISAIQVDQSFTSNILSQLDSLPRLLSYVCQCRIELWEHQRIHQSVSARYVTDKSLTTQLNSERIEVVHDYCYLLEAYLTHILRI